MTGSASLPPQGLRAVLDRLPPSWLGMSGYLVAGIGLGLLLIVALTLGRGGDASAAPAPATASVVTDNVTRLHARDLAESCWDGLDKSAPARLTVSLDVGLDGRVRYAAVSGGSPAMRGCVERYVRSWEFLPQSQATAMALPFEIDRR